MHSIMPLAVCGHPAFKPLIPTYLNNTHIHTDIGTYLPLEYSSFQSFFPLDFLLVLQSNIIEVFIAVLYKEPSKYITMFMFILQ